MSLHDFLYTQVGVGDAVYPSVDNVTVGEPGLNFLDSCLKLTNRTTNGGQVDDLNNVLEGKA